MSRIANHKGYTRNQLDAIIDQYILAAIPSHDEIWATYAQLTETDTDRINFVMSCYESEFNHEGHKRRYPNEQTRFANYLQGLPSCINIDYENHRILELANEWGTLAANATENQKDAILANWFNYMAFKIIRFHRQMNEATKKG